MEPDTLLSDISIINKLNTLQAPHQLKNNDMKILRTTLLDIQKNSCAICEGKIDDKAHIDHQHMTSKEQIGEDGAGLIRGLLCPSCNMLEGKIWNNMKRFKNPKNVQERINYLERIINYYSNKPYNLIHPSEKPKVKNISKRNYNKLKKIYEKSSFKRKFPEYPKNKKMTKPLQLLFNEFNIEPYN
jgi:hypothetical protein